MKKLCGKDVLSFIGNDSPFDQVISIGYDDGPTSGAVRCSSSSETYRFEMLARDVDGKYDWEGWDRGEEIRIFSLAPLPAVAFERFASTLSQNESRRKISTNETYFKEAYSLLYEAGSPELIITTHGIRTKIIAARQVSLEEITYVKDWFSFLGFTNNT